jgi:hypothetical protein
MAVKREEIELETEQIYALVNGATGKLIRNEAGSWTCVLELNGNIHIETESKDRTIGIVGEVRIRGRQRRKK